MYRPFCSDNNYSLNSLTPCYDASSGYSALIWVSEVALAHVPETTVLQWFLDYDMFSFHNSIRSIPFHSTPLHFHTLFLNLNLPFYANWDWKDSILLSLFFLSLIIHFQIHIFFHYLLFLFPILTNIFYLYSNMYFYLCFYHCFSAALFRIFIVNFCSSRSCHAESMRTGWLLSEHIYR